jgi:FtsP/CotA-like multicopper oxidase with cupredoxin domain
MSKTSDDRIKPRLPAGSHVIASRRSVLAAGAGIASALALGKQALAAQHDHHDATPAASPIDSDATTLDATPEATPVVVAPGPDLVEPEVRASENGLLETSLTAAFGPAMVNGRQVTSRVFDGMYPAPTLKVRPGDTIRLKVTNDLDDITNVHTHGFHVSPSDNSDNVFVEIMPGETFDYEFQLPGNHAAGLYWYHPHVHGDTYEHVNGGMAGAIIIEGGLDEFPGIAGLTERLLVLQSSQFDADGVVVPVDDQSAREQLRTVNGQVNPSIRIRPGETQRWRIANMTSENFALLALEGHMLHQVAKDGQPLSELRTQERILMVPGERIEVLVQAAGAGTYELRQLLWGTGFQSQPDVVLATMVVDGDPVDPAPLPTTLIPFEDLREVEVDNYRELTFDVTQDHDGVHFLIDGKTFDHDRVDQTVQLGATEEWVINNASDEWHPFHIHINDFQVVAVNGEPYEAYSWEDTRGLPPNGSITMRSRFLDFTGKYVYHCHILFHEDMGMMGIVEVVE